MTSTRSDDRLRFATGRSWPGDQRARCAPWHEDGTSWRGEGGDHL